MDKDLKTTLLDDEDFVKLIEREAAAAGASDRLAQERVWQRLQGSAAARKKPWAGAWIAAALVLIGVGGAWLWAPFPEDRTFKSGGNGSPAVGGFTLVSRDSTLEISLSDGRLPFAALIQDGQPFTLLWQGAVRDWAQPLIVPQSGPGRICLLEAETAGELSHSLDLMRELKEIPGDLVCQPYP